MPAIPLPRKNGIPPSPGPSRPAGTPRSRRRSPMPAGSGTGPSGPTRDRAAAACPAPGRRACPRRRMSIPPPRAKVPQATADPRRRCPAGSGSPCSSRGCRRTRRSRGTVPPGPGARARMGPTAPWPSTGPAVPSRRRTTISPPSRRGPSPRPTPRRRKPARRRPRRGRGCGRTSPRDGPSTRQTGRRGRTGVPPAPPARTHPPGSPGSDPTPRGRPRRARAGEGGGEVPRRPRPPGTPRGTEGRLPQTPSGASPHWRGPSPTARRSPFPRGFPWPSSPRPRRRPPA